MGPSLIYDELEIQAERPPITSRIPNVTNSHAFPLILSLLRPFVYYLGVFPAVQYVFYYDPCSLSMKYIA